jgi:hypothetical protein
VRLLAPVARQVLTEMNTSLLLDTGQLTETGLRNTEDAGLEALWALSWPAQRAAGSYGEPGVPLQVTVPAQS